MPLTDFDKNNIDRIMSGEGTSWYTAQLLRLMAKADTENLTKLAYVYPEEFIAFCNWKWNGVPARFITVDTVRNLMEYNQRYAVAAVDYPHWIDPDGKTVEVKIKHGRDM